MIKVQVSVTPYGMDDMEQVVREVTIRRNSHKDRERDEYSTSTAAYVAECEDQLIDFYAEAGASIVEVAAEALGWV